MKSRSWPIVLAVLTAVAALASAALSTSASASTVARTATAAAARSVAPSQHGTRKTITARPVAQPAYEQHLHSEIKCAHWKGDLSWGGRGSPAIPGFIHLTSSVLTDTCSNGYAQLFIHYDTVDNPKNVQVCTPPPHVHCRVEAHSSGRRPYSTEDPINTYKDIYVYICSRNDSGYRCGNHKGPGA